MNDFYVAGELAETTPEPAPVMNEEFFEKTLFEDIFEMKSIAQVSEKTAVDIKDLQDEVYQTLFNLFQKTRGITPPPPKSQDDVLGIFELFFKNYYQHFRSAMENLIAVQSPVKVAYYLGRNSDKLLLMLDQFLQEIEWELR